MAALPHRRAALRPATRAPNSCVPGPLFPPPPSSPPRTHPLPPYPLPASLAFMSAASLSVTPCGRALYPAEPFSLQHWLYIGLNLSFHAVSWGLVYVWTTFWTLLHNDRPLDELLVWAVGAGLFVMAGLVVRPLIAGDTLLQELCSGTYRFYLSAAFTTLLAGA
jgi:hypothetical protein